ncbi:hypothetical protein AURDEDRAFT_170249 [Auricularia subglabra TFB-10046 SS5]|nr:hypothetical protein AURDEDRAFT_170249 [Auricularia subglabra TFB-10046 SS5]
MGGFGCRAATTPARRDTSHERDTDSDDLEDAAKPLHNAVVAAANAIWRLNASPTGRTLNGW